jgi:hypothetical protein
MTLRNFGLDLDEAIYQAAVARAQGQGKTLEHVLAELLAAYSRGEIGGELTTYTVQRGDSLATIARQVYGDPHHYPLIQKANNLSDPGRIWVGQVLVIPPVLKPAPETPPVPETKPAPTPKPKPAPKPPKPKVDPCSPIPGESYGTLPIVGPPADRPAAHHGDINLALRGFIRCGAAPQLIDMSGPTDTRAPQLAGLFGDKRTPVITNTYQVHHWDWASNSRGKPITDFEANLIGCQVKAGEPLHVPPADYSIGQGYAVLVLYADSQRITLKYTGEDSVVSGYTVHVEGVCPDPNLLALYEQMNAAGRRHLPALRAGQAFGRAREAEIQVTIRDTGRFMDPRVRKDWWRGR